MLSKVKFGVTKMSIWDQRGVVRNTSTIDHDFCTEKSSVGCYNMKNHLLSHRVVFGEPPPPKKKKKKKKKNKKKNKTKKTIATIGKGSTKEERKS